MAPAILQILQILQRSSYFRHRTFHGLSDPEEADGTCTRDHARISKHMEDAAEGIESPGGALLAWRAPRDSSWMGRGPRGSTVRGSTVRVRGRQLYGFRVIRSVGFCPRSAGRSSRGQARGACGECAQTKVRNWKLSPWWVNQYCNSPAEGRTPGPAGIF